MENNKQARKRAKPALWKSERQDRDKKGVGSLENLL